MRAGHSRKSSHGSRSGDQLLGLVEQRPSAYLKWLRKLLNNGHGGITSTPLYIADIGPMDSRLISKSLLTPPLRLA